jgi:hypothetical protein
MTGAYNPIVREQLAKVVCELLRGEKEQLISKLTIDCNYPSFFVLTSQYAVAFLRRKLTRNDTPMLVGPFAMLVLAGIGRRVSKSSMLQKSVMRQLQHSCSRSD